MKSELRPWYVVGVLTLLGAVALMVWANSLFGFDRLGADVLLLIYGFFALLYWSIVLICSGRRLRIFGLVLLAGLTLVAARFLYFEAKSGLEVKYPGRYADWRGAEELPVGIPLSLPVARGWFTRLYAFAPARSGELTIKSNVGIEIFTRDGQRTGTAIGGNMGEKRGMILNARAGELYHVRFSMRPIDNWVWQMTATYSEAP